MPRLLRCLFFWRGSFRLTSSSRASPAERRLGEMIAAQKATVGLRRGVVGSTVSGAKQEPLRDTRPSLADVGIDKAASGTF